MTAVHLDHDFPYEPAPEYSLAGEIDGAPVYRGPAAAPSRAAVAVSPAEPGAGTSPSSAGHPSLAGEVLGTEIAEYRTRTELLAQLVELVAPAGIWPSFFRGVTRRHRVERLEQLPAEVLHTVVEQAHQVAAARGGR